MTKIVCGLAAADPSDPSEVRNKTFYLKTQKATQTNVDYNL